MTSIASVPRSSAETKTRIILVAQDIFAAKGYSHAGLREIATVADVAPSLVIKYFGTKARLFEEALIAAILPIQAFQEDRDTMGETIVAAVLDPASRMHAPAMIALALGDPESRDIATRVMREQIMKPVAEWLGSANARAQALNMLAMTTGFSIFHRNMEAELAPADVEASARLFARSLQDIVDAS